MHLITDRNGVSLSLGISDASLHDSLGPQPLVRGIPPIRSRRCPRRRRPAAGIAASLMAHRRLAGQHKRLSANRRAE